MHNTHSALIHVEREAAILNLYACSVRALQSVRSTIHMYGRRTHFGKTFTIFIFGH